MKFTNRTKAMIAVLAATLALAGCSSTGGGGSTSAPSASGDAYSIGYVAFDMSNSTTVKIWEGLQSAAEENGWQAANIDSTGDPSKAISAIDTFVQKKVSVIFIGVFPPAALAAGLAEAKSAGIPVASFGGGTGDGVQTDWSFGTEPGTATGEEVLKLTDGEGALLMLGYKPGTPCLTREAAFMEAIDGKNTFSIQRQELQFPGQVEISTQYTQAWLTKNPSGSQPYFTIWACTDDGAVGAAAAVRQAGRTDIQIISFDGTPEGIRGVQDGSITINAWIDGAGTAEEAIKDLPEIIARGVSGTPVEGSAVFQIVDSSNLDAFLADHPDALG